nr:multiple epidermal growth factor-like domains protein 8 [Taeniopygia guttata]
MGVPGALFLGLFWVFFGVPPRAGAGDCKGQRQILTGPRGFVTDGPGNYSVNGNCEWLIQAPSPRHRILLSFTFMDTECTYDYLFVYDGASTRSPLLAALSGSSLPAPLEATSGQMLLHLFSDANYNLLGFNASWRLSLCPGGCSGRGRCVPPGLCRCAPGWAGPACTARSCSAHCRPPGGACNQETGACECRAGFLGFSCDLRLGDPRGGGRWYRLSDGDPQFRPRAAAAGAVLPGTGMLYVFGGLDLNEALGDLVRYNFSSNRWERIPETPGSPAPAARHSHSAVAWGDTLLIFGGQLRGGALTNDLWGWGPPEEGRGSPEEGRGSPGGGWRLLQPPQNGAHGPPGLAGHAAALVDGDWLYVFGGRTSSDVFSPDLFRLLLPGGPWERVGVWGGKAPRAAGHALLFLPHARSLLVYGGHRPSTARFSVRVNSSDLFHLERRHWSSLRARGEFGGGSQGGPRERAFHSASLIGDYMVVFGGNVHTHYHEEKCYEEELHFYHLRCHRWSRAQPLRLGHGAGKNGRKSGKLGSGGKWLGENWGEFGWKMGENWGNLGENWEELHFYHLRCHRWSRAQPLRLGHEAGTPGEGRYSHVSGVLAGQVLLVAGGFSGVPRGDLRAYKVPSFVLQRSEEPDPNCGSSGTNPEQCPPGPCPGLSRLLGDCESCLAFGGEPQNPPGPDSPAPPRFGWCVQNDTCVPLAERSRCRVGQISGTHGWWGPRADFLTELPQCRSRGVPPGLHLLTFQHPKNESQPDKVSLIRSATITLTPPGDAAVALQFRGFLHPLLGPAGPGPNVWARIQRLAVVARLAREPNSTELEEVGRWGAQQERETRALRRPRPERLFGRAARGSRFLLQVEALLNASGGQSSELTLTWDRTGVPGGSVSARKKSGIFGEFLGIFSGVVSEVAKQVEALLNASGGQSSELTLTWDRTGVPGGSSLVGPPKSWGVSGSLFGVVLGSFNEILFQFLGFFLGFFLGCFESGVSGFFWGGSLTFWGSPPQPRPHYFHAAAILGDTLVVVGGRSDRRDFGNDVLLYQIRCNAWILPPHTEPSVVGPPMPGAVGHALAQLGGLLFLSGGFNGGVLGGLWGLRVPPEPCGALPDPQRCNGSGGACAWCGGRCRGALEAERLGCSPIPAPCAPSPRDPHECRRLRSCSECLAQHPLGGAGPPACKWCTNCPEGACIGAGSSCRRENDCRINQREIFAPQNCSEAACGAPDCPRCASAGRCMWTRQFKRTGETRRILSVQPAYEWTCFSHSLLNVSPMPVESAPPLPCPRPCHLQRTCAACLASAGADGGWQHCLWSLALRQCLSPSFAPLLCLAGGCGRLLRGPERCPSPPECGGASQCSQCLRRPRCGWCARGGHSGAGRCLQGGISGPLKGASETCGPGEVWAFLSCPPEDECENGHHTCGPSQVCRDLPDGFTCACREGFSPDSRTGECRPVCRQGCANGTCVEPDRCRCHFGFVGSDCGVTCACNGHSDCAGPRATDTCLQCHNNTQGPQCQRCRPLFVGSALGGGTCLTCRSFCRHRADVCLSRADLERHRRQPDRYPLEPHLIHTWVQEGPSEAQAVCVNCQNNSVGDRCDTCRAGFFLLDGTCTRCQCNGHADTCNELDGTGCPCQNNTESGACPERRDCHRHQCSKCRDSFQGHPVGGQQCYRLLAVEQEYCLDAASQSHCFPPPQRRPLPPGRSVPFAVQPKFTNVDIRLTLDVTFGVVDLYVATSYDTFAVDMEPDTGWHRVRVQAPGGGGGTFGGGGGTFGTLGGQGGGGGTFGGGGGTFGTLGGQGGQGGGGGGGGGGTFGGGGGTFGGQGSGGGTFGGGGGTFGTLGGQGGGGGGGGGGGTFGGQGGGGGTFGGGGGTFGTSGTGGGTFGGQGGQGEDKGDKGVVVGLVALVVAPLGPWGDKEDKGDKGVVVAPLGLVVAPLGLPELVVAPLGPSGDKGVVGVVVAPLGPLVALVTPLGHLGLEMVVVAPLGPSVALVALWPVGLVPLVQPVLPVTPKVLVAPEPILVAKLVILAKLVLLTNPLTPDPILVAPEKILVAKPVLMTNLMTPDPILMTPDPISVSPNPILVAKLVLMVNPMTPDPILVAPEKISVAKPVLMVNLMTPEPILVSPNPILVSPNPILVSPNPILVSPNPILVSPNPILVAPNPILVTPEPILVAKLVILVLMVNLMTPDPISVAKLVLVTNLMTPDPLVAKLVILAKLVLMVNPMTPNPILVVPNPILVAPNPILVAPEKSLVAKPVLMTNLMTPNPILMTPNPILVAKLVFMANLMTPDPISVAPNPILMTPNPILVAKLVLMTNLMTPDPILVAPNPISVSPNPISVAKLVLVTNPMTSNPVLVAPEKILVAKLVFMANLMTPDPILVAKLVLMANLMTPDPILVAPNSTLVAKLVLMTNPMTPDPILVAPNPILMVPNPILMVLNPLLVSPNPISVAELVLMTNLMTPEPILVAPNPILVAPNPIWVAPNPTLMTKPVFPTTPPPPSPIWVAPSPILVAPDPILVSPNPILVAPNPILVAPNPILVAPNPTLVPKPVLPTNLMTPDPILVAPNPILVAKLMTPDPLVAKPVLPTNLMAPDPILVAKLVLMANLMTPDPILVPHFGGPQAHFGGQTGFPNHPTAPIPSRSPHPTTPPPPTTPPSPPTPPVVAPALLEERAHGLVTYLTVARPVPALVVRGVRDRLVLTYPHAGHALKSTRFYLLVVAGAEPCQGLLFFRQDQAHIDLFIFFSVFFSCFFLFLALCVLLWKAKQGLDARHERRRHRQEMSKMAARPFARVTVCFQYLGYRSWSVGHQQNHLMGHQNRSVGHQNHPPRDPHPTHRKAPQSLPGPPKPPPGPPKPPPGPPKPPPGPPKPPRGAPGGGPGAAPVTLEPTEDGLAAVATLLLQLPGGPGGPPRAALGSALVVLRGAGPVQERGGASRKGAGPAGLELTAMGS